MNLHVPVMIAAFAEYMPVEGSNATRVECKMQIATASSDELALLESNPQFFSHRVEGSTAS